MAEDDIYGSKGKYEKFKANVRSFGLPASRREPGRGGLRVYYCKNQKNLEYFPRLFSHFEARDISYIRRIRLIQTMRLICYLTVKDLATCSREDINQIVASMHEVYTTPKSKETFIWDMKYFWKILFPEKDERGRPDETLVPYVVRHLSSKSDKSRQKKRRDKLTWEEFEKLLNYFSRDVRMQAFLSLALESLGRPQELLYLKIGDVELYDSYARIFISEHGKEGVGLLQCIDSYPYLLKWLGEHPFKKDKAAFLFMNVGTKHRWEQLKPKNINKFLRIACHDLGIEKPITCYSLKRSGVTLRRLRGDSDMEIQHAARWTSTKQLKTYDLSNQDEAFRNELEKRGLVPKKDATVLTERICAFCQKRAGFGEVVCRQCKRPLDRTAIHKQDQGKATEVEQLRAQLSNLTEQLQALKNLVVPQMAKEIVEAKDAHRYWRKSRNSTKLASVELPRGFLAENCE